MYDCSLSYHPSTNAFDLEGLTTIIYVPNLCTMNLIEGLDSNSVGRVPNYDDISILYNLYGHNLVLSIHLN